MLRFKRAVLFAVLSSKSWMLVANILLATGVTTASEARVTEQTQPFARAYERLADDGYMQVDPIDQLNSVIGKLGTACAPGTTVKTDNGVVCGIVVNGINSWQGIPFAAPPVGDPSGSNIRKCVGDQKVLNDARIAHIVDPDVFLHLGCEDRQRLAVNIV